MLIRKIILKDDNGAPCGVVTVRTGREALTLSLAPRGNILLVMSGERVLTPIENGDGIYTLPLSDTLTLLARIGDKKAFGSEENGAKITYMKWRAETLLREKSAALEKNVIPSDIPEETPPESTREVAREKESLPLLEPSPAEPSPLEEIPPTPEPTATPAESTTRNAFEEGEPFPYFERLIEGSRWVKVLEGGYLLGIFQDGDDEIEMVGVPGHLGTAPDDDHAWEYIPSEESEDEGYYVRRK